jgi:hypothetical protein
MVHFPVDFPLYWTYIGILWSQKDADMDNPASATTTARDASGRFLPGQSGNPAGKRPGTRNRATLIREAFDEGEEMAVARSVIDKAKSGDVVSARFLLGLLCPRPRGRAITLDLPADMSAGDTVAAFNTTLLAMAAGEITPDEALTITRVFDGRLQALKAWELERQMTWVRRETIPGDNLFAPPDEEGDDEEGEVAEVEGAAAARGPSTTPLRSFAQDEAGPAFPSASAADSPHPELPASAGKSKDMGPEQDLAAPTEHLHSACIEQAQEAETAALLAAQRKLAQWSHVLAQQPGFSADAWLKAEVAAKLSAAPR